jgi:hypothetical protein
MVFTLSVFLFYLAEKIQSIRIVHTLLLLVALSLPSILAGCRDLTIGVDVRVYAEPLFQAARYYNAYSLFSDEYKDIEPLYKLLVYLSASYSNKIAWLLFLQQFIIMSAVYYSCYQLKDIAPSYIFFVIYFLSFFNLGLNMMRQMLALSFCLISFSFLLKHKFTNSLLAFLPAMGFHSTAFIYLIVYPVFYLANKQAVHAIRLFGVIGLCIPVLLVFYIDDILTFLILQNILSAKFFHYNIGMGGGGSFGYTVLATCVLAFIVMQYSCIKNLNRKQYILFNCLLFICAILYPLGFFIHNQLVRCVFYFMFLSTVFFPIILYDNKKICVPLKFFVLVIVFLLFCWYKNTVVDNEGMTIPYTSEILGI